MADRFCTGLSDYSSGSEEFLRFQCYSTVDVQTEILGGDIEGLRSRLFLYDGRLSQVESELQSTRDSTVSTLENQQQETDAAYARVALIRAENDDLREQVYSLELQVHDLTGLLEGYRVE